MQKTLGAAIWGGEVQGRWRGNQSGRLESNATQWLASGESSGLNSPPCFPHLLLKPSHLQAAAASAAAGQERAGETKIFPRIVLLFTLLDGFRSLLHAK